MTVGERLFCGLQPCLPILLDGTPVNDEIVRASRSFVTFEAYYRHLERGHFIPKVNAPLPYWLSE
jgi:hypothetical protein